MRLSVKPDGTCRFIYKDELADMMREVGELSVRRASHVEPTNNSKGLSWQADLSPVGGPVLGPFTFRWQALEAEEEWLNGNVL